MDVVDYSQQMGYIYYRRILMPALLAGCCAMNQIIDDTDCSRQTRGETKCRCCERPKSTIFRPFDAHWRGHHDGSGKRRRQALLCRVEMKNWPFAWLKTGSTTSAIKKWPDDFSMIRRLNSYWRGLSISGIIINTWQSTNINFDENIDDSLITLALHSMTTTAASLRSATILLLYYYIYIII